jgi:hypothetical protein
MVKTIVAKRSRDKGNGAVSHVVLSRWSTIPLLNNGAFIIMLKILVKKYQNGSSVT